MQQCRLHMLATARICLLLAVVGLALMGVSLFFLTENETKIDNLSNVTDVCQYCSHTKYSYPWYALSPDCCNGEECIKSTDCEKQRDNVKGALQENANS